MINNIKKELVDLIQMKWLTNVYSTFWFLGLGSKYSKNSALAKLTRYTYFIISASFQTELIHPDFFNVKEFTIFFIKLKQWQNKKSRKFVWDTPKIVPFLQLAEEKKSTIFGASKVIYTKYYKHWPYTVAHTIDCVCSKIDNPWFNPWFSFYFSSLYPAPYIKWYMC